MKRVISLFLALALMLSSAYTAYAMEPYSEWSIEYNLDGSSYLRNKTTGEIVLKAFRLDNDGHVIEISFQEYIQEINSLPQVIETTAITAIEEKNGDINSPKRGPSAVSYGFTESYNYRTLGTPKKVTSDVAGPGHIDYGESTTISASYGGDLSINSSIENAIQMGASFSWEVSLQSSAQFTVGYDIPAGRTGYIEFTPYLRVSVGTLTRKIISSTGIVTSSKDYNVWGKSPIKLSSGFADGLYALKLR